MLLRIQSAEGTKRVEVTPSDTLQHLYKKASETFGIAGTSFKLYHDHHHDRELVSSNRRSVKTSKLSHGDMLYLHLQQCSSSSSSALHHMDVDVDRGLPSVASSSHNNHASNNSSSGTVKAVVAEDEVDLQLVKEDGRIPGKRSPLLCHHKGNSRCIHCTDVDPWDENYLKTNNIKHMSFHTYVRKLKSGVDKGKFVQLSRVFCSIRPGCTDHPPWPQGVCSACQPSAMTLTRQPFRHVDAVIFENRSIVENFLTYWRTTGHQRAGLLYGRYVPHRDVPLGIRAEVAAIYEPPQEASTDHLRLLPDENKALVDEMAGMLGLCCVGWLFTDLVPLNASSGTVRHLRHSDTYFLSSHEVLTAAALQLQHPNPCALSPAGVYGSKFATVIVTGDADNQVHMEGYQVSHQCESLVEAGCIVPTLDAPELAYIRESSAKQCVPDVFFKEKDEYGNEVTRLGRPLPVEYLLIDLPVSTPNAPTHTFTERKDHAFPIENRLLEGHLQDFPTLAAYLRKSTNDASFLECMSDMHVLLFLSVQDVVPLRAELPPLLRAVRERDLRALTAFRRSEAWTTLEHLVAAAGAGVSAPARTSGAVANSNGLATVAAAAVASSSRGGAAGGSWTCSHCTFINTSTTGADVCDMCHLPR